MAQLARSVATLRIAGDDLVPEEISALLGMEPTHAQRKGEGFPGKSGVRVAKFGQWRLEAKDTEPESLDGQVAEILGGLNPDLQIWQSLAQRFRIDFFCGWFMSGRNEGVCISPATLRALADRGIELGIDIYAPDSDA